MLSATYVNAPVCVFAWKRRRKCQTVELLFFCQSGIRRPSLQHEPASSSQKKGLAAVFHELYLWWLCKQGCSWCECLFSDFLKKTSTGLRGNNLNNICAGLYEKTQPSTLWFAHMLSTHCTHATQAQNLHAINRGTKDRLSCNPFRTK